MKKALTALLLICAAHPAFSQKVVGVMGAVVGNTRNTPQVQYIITYDAYVAPPAGSDSATATTVALDTTKFALVTGSGQKVYASRVTGNRTGGKILKITFNVTTANFAAFEGLVGSDSGAYLINEAEIAFTSGTYAEGALQTDTQGKLAPITESDWNQYIINAYTSNYLFPQEFKVGTNLGQGDTSSLSYYLDVQQSRPWVTTTSNISFFWGLEGRWSTLANDPFNYAKLYPVVLQYDLVFSRLSLLGGVEIGAGGIGKNGRGTGMLNYEFRLPFDLVDLTFGSPRARIHPLIDISGQFSKAWSDTTLPDTLQQGLDVTGSIRYNIPVMDKYLLQTNACVNWSYQTKKVHYLYDLSLGYVVNGSVRVMVQYKQGYETVTQTFDKQLLVGFAFDALSKLVPN
jgi:hypothetical protein